MQHAIHKAADKGNQNYETRRFLWSNTGDFCVPSFLNQTCEEIPAVTEGQRLALGVALPQPWPRHLLGSPAWEPHRVGTACWVCMCLCSALPQPDSEKGVEGTSSEGRAGGLQSPGLANGSRYSR